jgi:hypothetical protein
VLPPSSYDDEVVPPFVHELTIENRGEFEQPIPISSAMKKVANK